MDITLRPATEEEFAGWRAKQMADYAAEIAASGSLPPEAAREKAERDTTTALPAGVHTPGQWIFRLLAGEQPVGWLWLGAPPPGGDPAMAWVYSVEVAEQSRGRGYGRAAMILAEEKARSRGMTSVGLNVHGSNADFHAGGSGQLSGELVADGAAVPPGDGGGGWQVC